MSLPLLGHYPQSERFHLQLAARYCSGAPLWTKPPLGVYWGVQFELVIVNESYDALDFDQSDFRLKDEAGDSHRAVLVVVHGRIPPLEIHEGESATASLLFELPQGVDPTELRFNMDHHVHRSVIYKFR